MTWDAASAASLLCRLTLGIFFVLSGLHKLFWAERRGQLAATFVVDVGPHYWPLMWIIPLGEFTGGLGVGVGLLTPLACVGLAAICLGACLLDGIRRIPASKPLDWSDYVDDVMYLPEVLYIVMLLAVLILGPGMYSLDYLISR